jgi:hypothetical protein
MARDPFLNFAFPLLICLNSFGAVPGTHGRRPREADSARLSEEGERQTRPGSGMAKSCGKRANVMDTKPVVLL